MTRYTHKTPADRASGREVSVRLDLACTGCKHDIPGDCARREFVDGWLKFPEGDCYELTHNTDHSTADKARIQVLRRELSMLRTAQAHLSGIPARHNLQRIAEREDELQTIAYMLSLYEREDAVYCEACAA